MSRNFYSVNHNFALPLYLFKMGRTTANAFFASQMGVDLHEN